MSKMSAKSKKRLCKLENKLLKLEKLELKDIVCSICQSILIEPVTLPCFHDFCQRCFNGSIENNALCCPLCRLRIGSWLRTATKQNSLVNVKLWNFIQIKFSAEVNSKLKGEDIDLPEEKLLPRLSAPGEIRSEYEAELQRLKAERLEQDKKQIEKTELLIKKIQEEEHEKHKNYLERLKQDELLAKQLLEQECKPAAQRGNQQPRDQPVTSKSTSRFKANTIEGYLAKMRAGQPMTVVDSPLLTDDSTSTDGSTSKMVAVRSSSRPSPELAPTYGKLLKTIMENKLKVGACLWNKENGKNDKTEEPQNSPRERDTASNDKEKSKDVIKSLLVSLPLPNSGVLQYKTNIILENRNETGSADSMRQELCFFKPIEKTSFTSAKVKKILPLRVPCLRADAKQSLPPSDAAPSRAQYLDSLCHLRKTSLAKNLPSAFVIALNILRVTKENSTLLTSKCQPIKMSNINLKKKIVGTKRTNSRVPNNSIVAHSETLGTNLRRTRSMGSINKDENETTPKKAKIQHKSNSERKPHLRSDSKRQSEKKISSPIHEAANNNKLNLAVKNLSSPLKNCDVKKILEEQLRIEKIIDQEKKDLEMARQMDAEWNGRRHLRRAPGKRQVTLNYALRPAKKVKV